MFAFGHYDHEAQSLLLARDAFGEKPLYYANTDFETGDPHNQYLKILAEQGIVGFAALAFFIFRRHASSTISDLPAWRRARRTALCLR